jgi:arabinofuranosyltransferase
MLVWALVLFRTAWLSDDAYITYRTVDNLVGGYGLRWNPAERVQSFTHPLWLAVNVPLYALTGEGFYTFLVVPLLTSVVVVVGVGLAWARRWPQLVLWGAMALSSKAFVDFSTSGLENPLSHLLILATFIYCLRCGSAPRARCVRELGVLWSLIALTRPDLVLVTTPLCLVFLWRVWRGGESLTRLLGAMAVGISPLVAWEIFSVVYYGSRVPNSPLAKLGSGVPSAELVAQGLRYIENSLLLDPPTLVIIAGGLASAALVPAREMLGSFGRPARISLAIGVVLYLLYVVWIGGDFMSGRFLTVPMFAAAILILTGEIPGERVVWPVTAIALMLLSLAGPAPPWATGREFATTPGSLQEHRAAHGIEDERAYYFGTMGMWPRLTGAEENYWAGQGRAARRQFPQGGTVVVYNTGVVGFHAGPRLHLIDELALNDAFLARLPARREGWRVGHYRRAVPPGYETSVIQGRPQMKDPALNALYSDVLLVTRGPLFSADRFSAILRLQSEQR